MDLIRKDLPSINSVNILFLIVGLLLLFVGSRAQRNDLYQGVIITEYLLILLPTIIFLKVRGFSLKRVLKLNPLSLKQFVYIFFIMVFAYPVAVFLNFIMIALVSSVSQAVPISVPIPDNFLDYLIGLFVVAITPGICEEVMFRGTLQAAYSKLSIKKGLIISSILFGIFHFNLLNLLGPIFLGLVLGIILIKTNSLYGSILGHILNNAFAMTLGYVILKFTKDIDIISKDVPLLDSSIQAALTGLVLLTLALSSFVVLYVLLKNLPTSKVLEEPSLTSVESDLQLEDDLLLKSEIVEVRERIMWSPLIIIGGIFIYSNWVYFFSSLI